MSARRTSGPGARVRPPLRAPHVPGLEELAWGVLLCRRDGGANLAEGGVNGTTSFDRTNFFATVPSGNLETLLWIESDRLATLAEAMTQEKLDNQREVVKNERREGLENTPYGRWLMLLMENLHPAGHPYAHDVIGSHEDLTAASLEDVNEFSAPTTRRTTSPW